MAVVHCDDEFADAIDAVRPSIIQVAIESANHQSRKVVGTGLLVHSDGYALTARHFAEDAQSIVNEVAGARMMAGLALPNLDTQQLTSRASFELVGLDVVKEDQRHDLFLLRLVPSPFTMGRPTVYIECPMAASGSMRSSDWRPWRIVVYVTVRAWQCPATHSANQTSSHLGMYCHCLGRGIKEVQPPGASPGFTMPDVKDSFLADVEVNPGNSGGQCSFDIGQMYRLTVGPSPPYRRLNALTNRYARWVANR